jgi:lipopolysaccharide/colanic/teichoic acid biosynthesis glycosyltransferase
MVYDFTKRLLDIIGSTIALIILAPFFLLTAIAIQLDSPGTIMADTPMRVGKNGRLFKMYKFRSMVQNAVEILQKNPELMKQYKQNSYKIQDDPRITRVGKFIRKYSIDEFPQFLNIFNGDMTIVGPRAYYPFELEDQQKKYPNSKEFVKIILSSKPGLTGVWQVSGRSEINFDKRVEMDAQYVQRRSILFDLYLMLKTIPAVLVGRGAV